MYLEFLFTKLIFAQGLFERIGQEHRKYNSFNFDINSKANTVAIYGSFDTKFLKDYLQKYDKYFAVYVDNGCKLCKISVQDI